MTMIRVMKIGGSLLDWPLLGSALWEWLQQQPAAANYLLAGGGALADAIRAADQTHALGEERCHDLSLQVMGVTGAILEQLLAQAKASPGATSDQQRRTSVLDVKALLSDDALTSRVGCGLPHSWDVTSDSIAAYLAEALGAHELVLLKSRSLPGSMTFLEASHTSYVDPYFPIAARRVAKVRAVCLRDTIWTEAMLFA